MGTPVFITDRMKLKALKFFSTIIIELNFYFIDYLDHF